MKLDRCEDADCTVCTDGYDYAECELCHKVGCPRDTVDQNLRCDANPQQVGQALRTKDRAQRIELAEYRVEQAERDKAEKRRRRREAERTVVSDQIPRAPYGYQRAPGVSDEAHAFNVSVRQGDGRLALHLRQRDRQKFRDSERAKKL